MSYPRKLQILVIEDDYHVIEAYKTEFETLSKEYQIAPPVFARSFADAKKHIDSDSIFQVVILDLNLPIESRQQPEEGFAPGEMLLEALAKREAVPIPVVLVISGKLGGPHSITAVQERLREDFWYGGLLIKGSPDVHLQLSSALDQALRYLDIGLHLRDSSPEWYPTLAPREDDLMRRCVLQQPSTVGVDVRWWGAEPGSSSSPAGGPTKVLMGRFLMDEGMGFSLPTFFKFEPAANASSVERAAAILTQKLGHIKVIATLKSRQRSLLVTQSVTHGVPIPLNEYLRDDPNTVLPHLPDVIGQIVDQLCALGDDTDGEYPLRSFFWKDLDRAKIESVWSRYADPTLSSAPSPLSTLAQLTNSARTHWGKRRRCIHGDLNSTNVAIGKTREEGVSAYILDSAGMTSDFAFRDLAYLEVTTILFNSTGLDEQLLQTCELLYGEDFVFNSELASEHSPFIQNLVGMVLAIRQLVASEQEQKTYALLVFNATLMQLFGLDVQVSANKIKNPCLACALAHHISGWIRRIAPELFEPLSNGYASI